MTTIKVTSFKVSNYERKYNAHQKSDRPQSPSRVFIDFGEDVWTHLANRRSRDYNAIRPVLLAELERQGIKVTKLRWSRYAGCNTCPCSGGFIIEDDGITRWSNDHKDYWATIAVEELVSA